jgi:hypothetical protein
MSNRLDITVGKFQQLNNIDNNDFSIMVVAADSYAKGIKEYGNIEAFLADNPTEESLILNVLQWSEFEDGVNIEYDNEGTALSYELDSISYVEVVGFPEPFDCE